MKISFVEVQNFRKLKSVRIDFDNQTTIFVGANNSGKTSAMLALRYFLLSAKTNEPKINFRDITIENWGGIDKIGCDWEDGIEPTKNLMPLLPALDIWLDVPLSEIHHVVHILPTIDWNGGLLGVRLQYQPKKIEQLKADYLTARIRAKDAIKSASEKDNQHTLKRWPEALSDFLSKRLHSHFEIKAYPLDPSINQKPVKGVARPQVLSNEIPSLEGNPFKSLIKVDRIDAQREFSDAGDQKSGATDADGNDTGGRSYKRKLSVQLREYYDRHINPDSSEKELNDDDLKALVSIQKAETSFDKRLKTGFSSAFKELEKLGYPGITNPKLSINTQLRATDGLKHGSALQYEIADPSGNGTQPLRLPDNYSGLGYQNLISMTFQLMGYRDEWMRVGKTESISLDSTAIEKIQPLHLVLVEEPEAHLHAQVQQVFIKKAYELLRNHDDLRKPTDPNTPDRFSTQLVITTHSSHVAHEADFSCLRYFRRRRAQSHAHAPTTTIANLSTIFGTEDDTSRFVARYLKATHCDLFFADAAIFVEGQAERILVPQFIQNHFHDLNRRYVTLLDVGGSHIQRFKPLIDELGIATLIISDLDAAVKTPIIDKNGKKRTVPKGASPALGENQITTNSVLKSWHPKIEKIDELVALSDDQHIFESDGECPLYVAYQKPTTIYEGTPKSETVIPRTFEDALIYANMDTLAGITGSSISNKIREVVEETLSGEDLQNRLFDLLKGSEKAAFALDCLFIEAPQGLVPPKYIHCGLTWLQKYLTETSSDTIGGPSDE